MIRQPGWHNEPCGDGPTQCNGHLMCDARLNVCVCNQESLWRACTEDGKFVCAPVDLPMITEIKPTMREEYVEASLKPERIFLEDPILGEEPVMEVIERQYFNPTQTSAENRPSSIEISENVIVSDVNPDVLPRRGVANRPVKMSKGGGVHLTPEQIKCKNLWPAIAPFYPKHSNYEVCKGFVGECKPQYFKDGVIPCKSNFVGIIAPSGNPFGDEFERCGWVERDVLSRLAGAKAKYCYKK